MSKVSYVHAHFKGKVDQDTVADEPAGGPKKVVSAFKHLRAAEQVAFMNEILSDESTSRHLLKKTFEGCLHRLTSKRVCSSVGAELSRPARVHHKDRKMKTKSRDVQRMLSRIAPLLSHDGKTALQMQILHSLADEDRAAGREAKTEDVAGPRRLPPRVKSVHSQAELLGDEELDALLESLRAVPLRVAENAAAEADGLRRRLTACRESLRAAIASLRAQTRALERRSRAIAPEALRPPGGAGTTARTAEALLGWLCRLAGETVPTSSGTTLWGILQDGRILAEATFAILLSRADDASGRWNRSSVLEWKRRADAERGGSMALLRDHVFPALRDVNGGLGVPASLATPARICQSDPDAAMALAAYLYCAHADEAIGAATTRTVARRR